MCEPLTVPEPVAIYVPAASGRRAVVLGHTRSPGLAKEWARQAELMRRRGGKPYEEARRRGGKPYASSQLYVRVLADLSRRAAMRYIETHGGPAQGLP